MDFNPSPDKRDREQPELSESSFPSRLALAGRYFSGYVENVFNTGLGIPDPRIQDYCSRLLTRFIRFDAISPARSTRGERLYDVAALIKEAECRHGVSKLKTYKGIGDYTLFVTGVIPQLIKQHERANTPDSIIDYHKAGKTAYIVASVIYSELGLDSDEQQKERSDLPDKDLLITLGDNFELLSFGLGEVMKVIRTESDPDAPIIIAQNN